MTFPYGINQAQSQEQKPILSAKMKESLDLLQMPLPDLLRRIEKEVLENPVLECGEPKEDGENGQCDGWEFPESRGGRGTAPADEKEAYDPFLFFSGEPTFSDFLLEQLGEIKTDAQTVKICRYLIADLDERGYLPESAEAVAKALKLADARPVEKAIGVLRRMEPAGIGASSLRECLSLQLERMPDSDPAEFEIVAKNLDLLAKNKIKAIAQKLGIPVSEAQEFCDRIRKLNPIPSSGFDTGARNPFVLPEATVRKDDNGKLLVEMNRSAARRLSIDPLYRALARTTYDRETQDYLKEKISRASSLIGEVSGRADTIFRILQKIVELQPAYFSEGPSALKPMTMKEVAQALDLNESTVSRAVRDKFILCPSGLVGVKSLFTARLENPGGGTASSSAEAKEKIRECVAAEDRRAPLSDQAIAAELQKRGIGLSRRTVAKYRGELGIPEIAARRSYR